MEKHALFGVGSVCGMDNPNGTNGTVYVLTKWRIVSVVIVNVNASVYAIVAALSSFRRMQRWMRVLPSRVACVLNERVGRIDRHFSRSRLLAATAANEPPPAAGAATTDNEANGSKSRDSRSQV